MSVATKSGSVEFRPRARILKLIGSELISDEIVAITELVKNAHDADASTVTITFRNVSGDAGEIIVSDDGTGMDLDTLLGRWMEPAGSSKTGADRRRTRRGRRVLGEKGLGRFSADKLASQLELISRCKGSPTEIRATFDWNQFDSESLMLSDIKNRWESRPAREIKKFGTILRMTGLRAAWTERMFRRLSTRLSRLRTPFSDLDGFAIRIESDEFPEYSGEVRAEMFERAPYNIDAVYDGGETVTATIRGEKASEHAWTEGQPPVCGPVRIRLFAYDLETDAVARIGPRMEVRAWLREWSGVSVYRDGFRIWPYGEPHDDWLRLDQRRVNNPVLRLSNNQLVGFVEITGDANTRLMDQTNREGLINNRALEDLRKLLHFVLHLLEMHRQSIRHPADQTDNPDEDADRKGPVGVSVAAALEKLARRSPENAVDLRRLATRLREERGLLGADHRRVLEEYSGLAALGQATIALSRAIVPGLQPLMIAMRRNCDALRTHLNRNGSDELSQHLEKIEKAVALATERISLVVPPGADERGRRSRTIDIVAELDACRSVVAPVLERASCRFELKADRKGVLRVQMRPEVLQRVLLILVSCALERLEGVRSPCIKIRASTGKREDECELVVSDNGPPPAAYIDSLLSTPFSAADLEKATPLGVVRDLLGSYGGRVEVARTRKSDGFALRVVLPRKRSRATV